MKTYTVKQGDTLSKIARDVLGDMSLWPELCRINNISNCDLIHPGTVLQLPSDNGSGKKKDNTLLVAAGIAGLAAVALLSRKKSKSNKKRK